MYWACATVNFTSFTPLIPPFVFCLVVLGTHTQAWACGASTCLPRSYTPVILHPSLNRQTRLRRMLKKMCVFRWVTLGRDPTYVCTVTYTCIQMCTPVSWAMKQTLIESKAHPEDPNWCCAFQCGCPRSQVTKEDAWLLISLAHKVTCQMHQSQMLAHFYTPILQHSGRTGINNPHVFI